MTPTQSTEQIFFDDWFGSQEARDAILPIAQKKKQATTDDLIEMMKISYLAGSEAQKAITRKEIADYLRNNCGSLSSAGVGRLADDIEAAREGSKA